MEDQERLRAMNRARVQRHRQRQREQAPVKAEVMQRRVTAAADRLEAEHPQAARYLAGLDPALGEALIRELDRRQFERAEARARSRDQGERPS